MPISSCTEKFIDNSSFTEKIKDLYDSEKRLDRILARFGCVVLVPTALITTALDTLLCLGAGLGALCTLGMEESLLERVIVYGYGGVEKILAKPYQKLLIAVSPSFPECNYDKDIFDKFFTTFTGKIEELVESEEFFKREVVSRLAAPLVVVAIVIADLFNIVIGIVCTPISFLLLGKSKIVNTLAYNGLRGIALIVNMILFPIALINPRSIFSKDESYTE